MNFDMTKCDACLQTVMFNEQNATRWKVLMECDDPQARESAAELMQDIRRVLYQNLAPTTDGGSILASGDQATALEQAKLEVEQASRGKDEFLAAISHELKTPLSHILGFADLLKEGLAGELSAEQKGMAQDIFDAGSKQLVIVNSLIELARLQAGKVKLQAKPEDPASMLGDIAMRQAAKAQASGLALAVEVEEGLGEMPLDREVVTLLLDQLLANAFKFTPPGGKISLVARRVPRTDITAPVRIEADEYLELAVADNGSGIPPLSFTTACTEPEP